MFVIVLYLPYNNFTVCDWRGISWNEQLGIILWAQEDGT